MGPAVNDVDGIGDPVSVSLLGGSLRRQALDLGRILADLQRHVARTPEGLNCAHERQLIQTISDALDRMGATLQSWTTESVEAATALRALASEAEAADLDIDGGRVVERPGPSRVAPEDRLREKERLAPMAARLAGILARRRGSLVREIEASSALLAGVAALARGGPPR